MLILTIDTCSETSTLGLVRDGALVGALALPSRASLTRRFQERLRGLLTECDVALRAVDAIAVTTGPGSFMGVRIGVMAAKTLAHWTGIRLIGVSPLAALAYPLRVLPDALLVSVLNARRQQAYLALFRGAFDALQRETPDLLLAADPFAELLLEHAAGSRHVLLVGQFADLPPAFAAQLPATACMLPAQASPEALAALASERLAHGEQDDPLLLAPVYMRAATD
jgi:tRNA threonylcarbamoyladenosine biosynthesis protein TsaB